MLITNSWISILRRLLHYYNPTAKPDIVPFSFPEDVESGKVLQISCLVTAGDEPITLQWYKDHEVVSSDHDTIINHLTTKVSNLLLPNVSSRHAGLYTCRASNIVGSSEFSSTLKVQGAWISLRMNYQNLVQGNMPCFWNALFEFPFYP